MATMLRISEAVSIALHSMTFIAKSPKPLVTSREIISALKVSDAHLMKVLQRLVKAELIKSTRGPNGGFVLSKSPDEITLMSIYESIEGPLSSKECLLGKPVYRDNNCLLGNLLKTVNSEVKKYFGETTLAKLNTCELFGGTGIDIQRD